MKQTKIKKFALLLFLSTIVAQYPIYNYACEESKKNRLPYELEIIVDEYVDGWFDNFGKIYSFDHDSDQLKTIVAFQKKQLQDLEKFEKYLLNNDLSENKAYLHERFNIVVNLATTLEFFPSYYQEDVIQYADEDINKKIIDIIETEILNLENMDGIYLYDNIANTNSIIFEYLILFTKIIFEYNDHLKDYSLSDKEGRYWLEKRFNYYEDIFKHKNRDLLARQIGQIESNCLYLSQKLRNTISQIDPNMYSKDAIESFYPIGNFEYEYLVFLHDFFYFDLSNYNVYQDKILESYIYVLEDFEKLMTEHTISINNYIDYDNVSGTQRELLLHLYVMLLDILRNSYAVKIISASSNQEIDKDYVVGAYNELVSKFTIEEIFQYKNYFLSLDFIEANWEIIKNLDSNLESSSLIEYHKKAYLTELKNLRSLISKDDSYIGSTYILANIDHIEKDIDSQETSFMTSMLKLQEEIYQSNGGFFSQIKLRMKIKNSFKKIDLNNLEHGELFFLLGFLSAAGDEVTSIFFNDVNKFSEQEEFNFLTSRYLDAYSFYDETIEAEDLFYIMASNNILIIDLLIKYQKVYPQEFNKFIINISLPILELSMDKILQNPQNLADLSTYLKAVHEIKWKKESNSFKSMYNKVEKIKLIDKLNMALTMSGTKTLNEYFYNNKFEEFFLNKNTKEVNNKFIEEIRFKIKSDEIILIYNSLDLKPYQEIFTYNLDIHPLSVIAITIENGVLTINDYALNQFDVETLNFAKDNWDVVGSKLKNQLSLKDSDFKGFYRLLIEQNSKLEDKVFSKKKITILTDPVFSSIVPFELLKINDNSSFLNLFDSMNYINSMEDYVNSSTYSLNKNDSVYGIGGVNYKTLSKLEYSDNEISNIENYFLNTTLIRGDDATKDNIVSALLETPIDVIHFSVHGTTDKNYLKSSLVFSSRFDEYLNYQEIRNLNLKDTKLVILSACDTNVGTSYSGFSSVGLQQSFKESGVNNVISTLWAVDDKATYLFMLEYYSFLEMYTSSKALIKSKQSFIMKYPQYQHPYYWAAFVHYGSN